MKFTESETRTVLAVFEELVKKPYYELNTFLGSLTIEEMQALFSKLKYSAYCESRGIAYEDMVEDDFIAAYEEATAR